MKKIQIAKSVIADIIGKEFAAKCEYKLGSKDDCYNGQSVYAAIGLDNLICMNVCVVFDDNDAWEEVEISTLTSSCDRVLGFKTITRQGAEY